MTLQRFNNWWDTEPAQGFGTRLWYASDIFTVVYFFTTGSLLYAYTLSQTKNDALYGALMAFTILLAVLQIVFTAVHLCRADFALDKNKQVLNWAQVIAVGLTALATIVAISSVHFGNDASSRYTGGLALAGIVAIAGTLLSVVNYRVSVLFGLSRSNILESFFGSGGSPKIRTFDLIGSAAQIAAFVFLLTSIFSAKSDQSIFQVNTIGSIAFPISIGMMGLWLLCIIVTIVRDWAQVQQGKGTAIFTDFIFGTYGLWGAVINGLAGALASASSQPRDATAGALLMVGVIVSGGGIAYGLAQMKHENDPAPNLAVAFAVTVSAINVIFTILSISFIMVANDPDSFNYSLNIAANTAGIGMAIAIVVAAVYRIYKENNPIPPGAVNQSKIRVERMKIAVATIQLAAIISLLFLDLYRQYFPTVALSNIADLPTDHYYAVVVPFYLAVALLGLAVILEIIRQIWNSRI